MKTNTKQINKLKRSLHKERSALENNYQVQAMILAAGGEVPEYLKEAEREHLKTGMHIARGLAAYGVHDF